MKTAVIIGAGPAGLSAAARLVESERDWRVVVLEETDAVGGISRTVRHNGCRIDIGGHRFFSKSDEVNAFWDSLMRRQGAPAWDDRFLSRTCTLSDGGPDPERDDAVMLRRRRVSRIFYSRHFFDYPISISLRTVLAMGIARTWRAGWSYLYSALFKREEKSLEDFYINRFGRVLYSMFFEDYTEKLWGIHPSRISPEWGAQRVKGLSLWKAVLNVFIPKGGRKETSLIDEFSYPKFGPGQLWELLAKDLERKGAEIRLNAPVTAVEMQNGRVISVSVGSERIACDALFSSMPVKDLVASMNDVPEEVSRIAADLPYRDFITVGLKVPRLEIKNRTKFKTVNGLVPDTWIYVQDRGVKMGRIQIFNNWSPYMLDDPQSNVWIGLEYFCSEGDSLWSASDEDFVSTAVCELKQIGVLGDETAVLDSVRIKVKKAYPAYFGSYSDFGTVRTFLDGIENLYCIGRNGQHRYNNMDHSMMCGFEAVRALFGERTKSSVWDVNTESDYHESK